MDLILNIRDRIAETTIIIIIITTEIITAEGIITIATAETEAIIIITTSLPKARHQRQREHLKMRVAISLCTAE